MPKNDSILKKTEISLRKKILRFLAYKGTTEVIYEPIDAFNFRNDPKILLLRQDRFGDVLISTPFFRIFRNKFPNSQIDIVLGTNNIGAEGIVKSKLDNIIEYKKGIWGLISTISSIRKQKYDLIVDLLDNSSTTSSILIKFSLATYKLGLGKENSFVYSHIVQRPNKQNVHIVERLAVLLKPFGIDPNAQDLSLEYDVESDLKNNIAEQLSIDTKKFNFAVNMSGSSIRKYWGTENILAFVQRLSEKYPNVNIYLFGTNDFRKRMEIIAEKSGVFIVSPSVGFDEYAAKLSLFDLIFTPDTAAVHLASAFKIPCLAIYDISDNSNNGMLWTPYGIDSEIVTTDSGNLSDISWAECFTAFEKLYSRLKNE